MKWLARGIWTVLAVAAWLQVATPAHGEIPGDGRPIILIACTDLVFAEAQAVTFVRSTTDPIGPGCWSVRPFYPTDIEDQKIVIGPWRDADNDTFAVYEIMLDNGRVVFPFAWWADHLSPIGWKI